MIPGSRNELSIKKVKTIKQRTPPAINIALVHVFVTKSALNTINNVIGNVTAKPVAIVGRNEQGPSIICPEYGK